MVQSVSKGEDIPLSHQPKLCNEICRYSNEMVLYED